MAESRISYTNRDFESIREDLRQITLKYYPDVFRRLDDSSIGQWLIDMMANACDSLNYHIDRVYQETQLGSAGQLSSLLDLARTSGLKIPGRKCAVCEVEISCNIPTDGKTSDVSGANESYLPVIKRGTLFSTGAVTFQLVDDVNFAEQFDANGYSDRQFYPNRDSNGRIVDYTYKKLAVVTASQNKIFKKVVRPSDLVPFMEILLQDDNVVGVESIIVKKGTNLDSDPDVSEFYRNYDLLSATENPNGTKRFYEVDNLLEQYRFGTESDVVRGEDGKINPQPEPITIDKDGNPVYVAQKGKWIPLKHKFVTEYTDDWKLRIIFGAGIEGKNGEIPSDAELPTQNLMSRMFANDAMGVLPEDGCTVYVLYRVGGGEISNIGKDTLTHITYLNMSIPSNRCDDPNDAANRRKIRSSLKVTNTCQSYGGKDEPTEEEIRYMIKYNNSAQNRCVTLHDYYSRINKMPAQFGVPFRVAVAEENNKVIVYTLGLDSEGKLTNYLAEVVANNMKEYLSMYRSINDLVEIRSGRVINVAFTVNLFVDKSYEKSEVAKRVIDTIYDYMDIHKHNMGENIFLGDLQKTISQLDGIINLISLRCFNPQGEGYSEDRISQELVQVGSCCYNTDEMDNEELDTLGEIDLAKSDYVLYSDSNSMFEIKNKEKDIVVNIKTR